MLILVRHGRTLGNQKKQFIGSTDLPLSQEGVQALTALKHDPGYPPCEKVVCSPLTRCRQTAAILFPGQEPFIMDGLREMDFGEYEELDYRQIQALPGNTQWGVETMVFPGGETTEDFRFRIVTAFNTLLQQEKALSTAVVCHGGTIMFIMEHLSQKPYYQWHVDCGHGFILHMENHRVSRYNPLFQQPEKENA